MTPATQRLINAAEAIVYAGGQISTHSYSRLADALAALKAEPEPVWLGEVNLTLDQRDNDICFNTAFFVGMEQPLPPCTYRAVLFAQKEGE